LQIWRRNHLRPAQKRPPTSLGQVVDSSLDRDEPAINVSMKDIVGIWDGRLEVPRTSRSLCQGAPAQARARWRYAVMIGVRDPPPSAGSPRRRRWRALGHPLDTDDEIERACIEHDLPQEELDARLNGFGWEDSWDNFTGPQAKAHHLLKGLDLGGAGSALRQAGPDHLRAVRGIFGQFLHIG
jgi:hypothetical protein